MRSWTWVPLSIVLVLAPAAGRANPAFFPIGMDEASSCAGGLGPASPSDSCALTTLDQIRAGSGHGSGFNVVHSYWHQIDANMGPTRVTAYLDEARKYGFKVLVNIAGYLDSNSEPPNSWRHFLERDPPFCDSAIALIRGVRDHPAVYGYYIADEPTDIYSRHACLTKAVSAQHLASACRTLRTRADDTHPYLITLTDGGDFPEIWGAANSSTSDWRWNNRGSVTHTSTFYKTDGKTGAILNDSSGAPRIDTAFPFTTNLDYTGSADIIANDTYVTHDSPLWTRWLRKFDDMVASMPGRSQAYLWCGRNGTGANSVRNSLPELRYQAFTAIIHGVSGVWFYGYGTANDSTRLYGPGCLPRRAPPYFTDVLVPLSLELSGIEGFLAGNTLGNVVWGQPHGMAAAVSDSALHYVIKRANGEAVLIAANTGARTLTGRIFLGTLPVSDSTAVLRNAVSVEVVGGGRRLGVTNGVLSDTFSPFDVHLYRFGGLQ